MSHNKYFFIGVGGIGMSSIANYLIDTKNIVFGYDRSSNRLVDKLIDNGLQFTDKLDIGHVPKEFLDDNVIVVYTPAIKNDNIFLDFFSNKKTNKIYKRSEILGQISANSKCIAVAGTHGKTSTTAILSHLLYSNQVKFRSFVGGIMTVVAYKELIPQAMEQNRPRHLVVGAVFGAAVMQLSLLLLG